MQNKATRYIADYIAKNDLSVDKISADLQISPSKISPGTEECLEADDFLRLCCYLHIRPESILIN
ncbi:MAG: hypothetical protein HFI41_05285 [Lachnospiraceae bacterium]|nr:hypothetical protein [Lachnospiraceae bacterium]